MLLLFLLFELLFRFVIPACENPAVVLDREFQIYKYQHQWRDKGLHTIGTWGKYPARWAVNKEGWISIRDYQKEKTKPRIAVIGDSFVAGLEVNTEETFHQLLHSYFKDSIEIYGFGFSGAPLSQYLQMAKYVEANFQPDLFIVNLVYNDFEESITQLSPYKRRFWTMELQADSSFQMKRPIVNFKKRGLKNLILKSALFRYLFHNLKIHKFHKRKIHWGWNEDQKHPLIDNMIESQNGAVYSKLIPYMLNQFKITLPEKRILFMIDGPRRAIYDGRLEHFHLNRLNNLVGEECERLGIAFLDLMPYFAKDYNQNRQKFEFPEDSHWNAYGHQVVSKVLFGYLTSNPVASASSRNEQQPAKAK